MEVTQVLNDAVPPGGVIDGLERGVRGPDQDPGPQRAAELADTLRILVAAILRPAVSSPPASACPSPAERERHRVARPRG